MSYILYSNIVVKTMLGDIKMDRLERLYLSESHKTPNNEGFASNSDKFCIIVLGEKLDREPMTFVEAVRFARMLGMKLKTRCHVEKIKY